jgi:hypothetical protein
MERETTSISLAHRQFDLEIIQDTGCGDGAISVPDDACRERTGGLSDPRVAIHGLRLRSEIGSSSRTGLQNLSIRMTTGFLSIAA